MFSQIQFIYSEKATKICGNIPIDMTEGYCQSQSEDTLNLSSVETKTKNWPFVTIEIFIDS